MMLRNIGIGVVFALVAGLYFLWNIATDLYAQRADLKYENLQKDAEIEQARDERAMWEQSRIDLRAKLRRVNRRYTDLRGKYEALSSQSFEFLDAGVPGDVADILYISDVPNLEAWIHATGGSAAASDYRPAYQTLKNADVYRQREQCLVSLQQCNAVLATLRAAYYPRDEPLSETDKP